MSVELAEAQAGAVLSRAHVSTGRAGGVPV